MSSHLWGVRLAALIAAAASLGACRTFSPDGGMEMVAAVAGTSLNKDVVQIRSAEDAAAVRARVTKLLHRPLGADAAVQIALLNNLGLQAALYEYAPAPHMGAASGQFQTFRYVGAILSTSLLGLAFGTTVTSHGLHLIAYVLAGISALLLMASITTHSRAQ